MLALLESEQNINSSDCHSPYHSVQDYRSLFRENRCSCVVLEYLLH